MRSRLAGVDWRRSVSVFRGVNWKRIAVVGWKLLRHKRRDDATIEWNRTASIVGNFLRRSRAAVRQQELILAAADDDDRDDVCGSGQHAIQSNV